jgi:hypothetical protein
MLPGFFLLLNFQVDQQCNLVFTLVLHTEIPLDFFVFAAYHKMTDILEALLALSVPSETCDPMIVSPPCLSLLNEGLDTATCLLSKGADPRGESCTNGLHAAARVGYLDMIVDFIIRLKIPPDYIDAQGAAPIRYALYLPERRAIETIPLLFSIKHYE